MPCRQITQIDAAARTSYAATCSGLYIPRRRLRYDFQEEHRLSPGEPRHAFSHDDVRRPSQRPINARWDQSRGLAFQTNRRATLGLHIMSTGKNPTRQTAVRAQRNYATRPGASGTSVRPPPLPRGPISASPTPKPAQTYKPADSPMGYDMKRKDTAAPAESEKARNIREKAALQAQLSNETREKLKAKSEREDLEQQRKALQATISTMKAQSEKDREDAWRRGQHVAERQVAQELGPLQSKLESALRERDKAYMALSPVKASLSETDTKLRRERELHSDTLGRLMSQHDHEIEELKRIHKREVLQETQGRDARDAVRKEYSEYQALFDKALEVRFGFLTQSNDIIRLLAKGRDRVRKLQADLQDFCRVQSGVAPYKNALISMAAELTQEWGTGIKNIETARELASKATSDFQGTAHLTRSMTRALRSHGSTSRHIAVELMHVILLGEPAVNLRNGMDQERSKLALQAKESDNATVREEIEHDLRAIQPRKQASRNMLAALRYQREYDVLQAVKAAPYVEQEAFMSTRETEESIKESHRLYRQYLDDNPDVKGSTGAIRQMFRECMNSIALQARKEATYAQGLDPTQTSVRQAEVHRLLDRLLREAEARKLEALKAMTGGGRYFRSTLTLHDVGTPTAPRVPGFARANSPSKTKASTPSRAAGNTSTIGLQTKLGLLARQLGQIGLTTDTKRQLQMEWASIKSQLMRGNLAGIARKVQNAPENMRRLYERETVRLQAQLEEHEARYPAITMPSSGMENSTLDDAPVAPPPVTVARVTYSPVTPQFSSAKLRPRGGRTLRKRVISQPRAYHSMSHGPPPRLHPRAYANITSRLQHGLPPAAAFTRNGSSICALGEYTRTPTTLGSTPASRLHYSAAMSAAVLESDSDSFADSSSESNSIASISDEIELTYKISPDDFKKAVVASPNTSAAFWSYRLYKDGDGKQPVVHYCKTYEQTVEQLTKFANYKVLGFDLEWEPYAHPGKAPVKRCVSLVQIAGEDRIGLFHLALFKGDTSDTLIPSALRQILENPNIAKTGVNVSGDAARLKKCFDIEMQGVFELSHLYRVVKFSEDYPGKVNKALVSLQSQVEEVLMLPMAKGEVRTSAWSKALNEQQCTYAASDAYAGLQLYHALEAKRRAMSPKPPRPAFYELHQPLILANGKVMIPQSRIKKAVGDTPKPTLDSDDEQFIDAEEELEDYELAPEHPAVSYPELPDLGQLSLDDTKMANAHSHSSNVIATSRHAPTTTSSTKSTVTTASPEYAKASAWIASWRAELPQTHVVKATNHILCVWHIWHHQQVSLPDLAKLLRDRPLAQSTVASYIADATSKEGLAFDVERMKEVLAIIPSNVHWRYGRVVKQLEEA
nr:hypothetical protein B0A51_13234 [Rachicladosporium sp. CCFEE 5018]